MPRLCILSYLKYSAADGRFIDIVQVGHASEPPKIETKIIADDVMDESPQYYIEWGAFCVAKTRMSEWQRIGDLWCKMVRQFK